MTALDMATPALVDVTDNPRDLWPAHGSLRACGEGHCTRCQLEQTAAEENQT